MVRTLICIESEFCRIGLKSGEKLSICLKLGIQLVIARKKEFRFKIDLGHLVIVVLIKCFISIDSGRIVL